MNNKRKMILLIGVLIAVVLLWPSITNAQITDPGCDPQDPACPIDGGLTLLIAAGIGLRARKVINDNKKKLK